MLAKVLMYIFSFDSGRLSATACLKTNTLRTKSMQSAQANAIIKMINNEKTKSVLAENMLCPMSLPRHCFSTVGSLHVIEASATPRLSAGLQHAPHRSVYRAGGPRQSNTLPRRHGGDGLIRHPAEHRFRPSALWSVSSPDSNKRMITQSLAEPSRGRATSVVLTVLTVSHS